MIPGGGPAGAGCGTPARGAPQAWQNALPSGFRLPHREQVSGIYCAVLELFAAGSARGRGPRLIAGGAAGSAQPQVGAKTETNVCLIYMGAPRVCRPPFGGLFCNRMGCVNMSAIREGAN